MKVPEIQAASNSVSTSPAADVGKNNVARPQSKSISNDFQRKINAANSPASSRSSAAGEGEVRLLKVDGSTKQSHGGRAHGLLKGQDAGLERAELNKALAELTGKDGKDGRAGKASVLPNPGILPEASQQANQQPGANPNAQAAKGDTSELTNAARDTQNKGQDNLSRNLAASNQSHFSSRNGLSSSASTSALRGEGSNAGQAAQSLSASSANQAQASHAGLTNPATAAVQGEAAARAVSGGGAGSGIVHTGQAEVLSPGQIQGSPIANPTAEAVMMVPFVDISGARPLKRTRLEDNLDAETDAVAEEVDNHVAGAEGSQASLIVAENGAELVEVTSVGEDEPEDKRVEGGVAGNQADIDTIMENDMAFDTLSLVGKTIDSTKNTKPVKDQKHWYESSNLNDEA